MVICHGADREQAKRVASTTLHGNKDNYICTPITRVSDDVVIKFAMGRKEMTIPWWIQIDIGGSGSTGCLQAETSLD